MNRDLVTLRSTVYPSLMRLAVLRGTALAGVGVTFLLAGGTLLPPPILEIWGLPIFLISAALITWGLLPYRRLRNLENFPHKLVIDEEGMITFLAKSKPAFMFPAFFVEHVDYIERGGMYGIGITLKKPLPQHDFESNLTKLQEISRQQHGCDIFLPYFSKRSCAEFFTALTQ